MDDDEVRLTELAEEVAQDAAKLGLPSSGAGVTFEELKRVIRQKNIYALQNGRYYVGVSLAEAESMRVAMHFSDCDERSNGDIVKFKNVQIALRIAGGTLLEGSRKYVPAGVFQGADLWNSASDFSIRNSISKSERFLCSFERYKRHHAINVPHSLMPFETAVAVRGFHGKKRHWRKH